jgi:hypothetical protein
VSLVVCAFRGTSRHQADAHGRSSSWVQYLILDMRAVPGVDATSARVCFLMLKQLLAASGVVPVFAEVSGSAVFAEVGGSAVAAGDVWRVARSGCGRCRTCEHDSFSFTWRVASA